MEMQKVTRSDGHRGQRVLVVGTDPRFPDSVGTVAGWGPKVLRIHDRYHCLIEIRNIDIAGVYQVPADTGLKVGDTVRERGDLAPVGEITEFYTEDGWQMARVRTARYTTTRVCAKLEAVDPAPAPIAPLPSRLVRVSLTRSDIKLMIALLEVELEAAPQFNIPVEHAAHLLGELRARLAAA